MTDNLKIMTKKAEGYSPLAKGVGGLVSPNYKL